MNTEKELVTSPKRASRRRDTIESFKSRMNARRTTTERIADWLTLSFGTIWFLTVNAIFFFAWIVWNTDLIPGLPAIDPFPFGLLTMVVSLEAIFLAIIVLISQNREGRIAELREELELYVDTYAETEITKIIYLLKMLLEHNGIDLSKDRDLHQMLQHLQSSHIEDELEKQVR